MDSDALAERLEEWAGLMSNGRAITAGSYDTHAGPMLEAASTLRELSALRLENERLVEALEAVTKYGRHAMRCAYVARGNPCDCGFRAALDVAFPQPVTREAEEPE